MRTNAKPVALACGIVMLATSLLPTRHAAAARVGGACALVSPAQVNAALGTTVITVEFGSDSRHCHWQQQGRRGEPLVEAHLMIESAQTYDTVKSVQGMGGKVMRIPLTGVGDDAYYLVSGRNAPLFARKGNTAVRVAVDGKGWTMDQVKVREKALASAVLDQS